ncbi:MAG TPA: EutN/CcmL family microcompartment protein [bacterium]|nr:EutN/CcmL family microcompartment protein [bacterium]HOL48854.1 EutN/CcmL family microcompartment protein [bacterium]HPQ19681.1 EutN/CcmL family microcompartment protein [bacterium]
MKLGRVIGRTVATKKYERMTGYKYLLVQPVDFELKEEGEPTIAVDAIGAGAGEIVILAKGGEAMLALGDNPPPIDKACVAIVDNIYYYKDA